MKAVGVRELARHVAGETTLEAALAAARQETRRYAKRQMTWLRRRTRARWFDSLHPGVARMMRDALTECGFADSSDVTPQRVLC